MMRYLALGWLLVLLLGACQTEKEILQPMPPDPTPPPVLVPITYLALGDSYTIGESVTTAERYPVQLVKALRQAGVSIQDPRIIARTGWTTDELNRGIDLTTDLPDTFGLVSLLIGVNNQYRGRPVSTYRTEFTQLLNRAIAFAGGRRDRVFVISIPDYAYTPFGGGSTTISAGIDAYNAVNEEISLQEGVRYFNITPISREGLQDLTLVAADGLHPSGKQYARWVSLMYAGVKAML